MSDTLSRIEQVEKRLQLIEKRLERTMKEHELTLKEKFSIHDHTQGLIRWFEEIIADVPEENVWFSQMSPQLGFQQGKPAQIKELKKIIKNFSDLVDNALGVKF